MKSPLLAINTVEDHVHVAVMIAPRWSIADWARYVKGVSSHSMNALLPNLESRFYWQHEYGVTTFGKKNLETVLSYIHNQKEHHRTNQGLISFLEDTGDEPNTK